MAVRKEYKINPIDLKKNVAVGVKLPMGGRGIFQSSYTTEEQAISNLKNLILTRKGERPFQPVFGSDVYSLLFEQMTGFLEESLKSSIKQDVNFWLPYILLDDVIVNTLDDFNRVNISLKFRVTQSGANQTIIIYADEQGGLSAN
jgi:phage baseplate assembly protein W